jgi:DNA-binding NarL/FixJ family response regulator
MTALVLVGPSDLMEAQCVAKALEKAGIATTSSALPEVCAVVEVALPGSDGASISVDPAVSAAPLLVVTDRLDEVAVGLAERLGAVGLVSWHSSTEVLVAAVRDLLQGTSHLPSAMASAESDPLAELTHRERDVVELLALGARNDEIAVELSISHHTVRTHVQNVLAKLGAPHRHAVAAQAQRSPLHRTWIGSP